MEGWIKLHRKLLNWEWYEDVNVRLTFIHCLLVANYESKQWQGKTIERGQFITSLGNLSNAVGISPMKLRTALDKLKKTGEITIKTTNKYTAVTVVKYGVWQGLDCENNKPITNKQQTNNKQITTTKEVKNKRSKEVKKEEDIVAVSNEPPSALPFKKEFLTICTKFREITGKELRVGKTDSLIKRSDKYKRIKARLKEGAKVEEMIAVIEHKTEQWKNDKRMQQYLRIATLFNASNYEAYIDEIANKVLPISETHEDDPNLPKFENEAARHKYFYFRFEKYRKELKLDAQEGNRLRKEALNKKQAERVCRMLENKYPILKQTT